MRTAKGLDSLRSAKVPERSRRRMLFSLMGALMPSVAIIPASEMMLMMVNSVMVRNIPTTVAIVYLIKLFIVY